MLVARAAMAAVMFIGGLEGIARIYESDSQSLMDKQAKFSHLFAAFVATVPKIDKGQYSVVIKECQRPKLLAIEYAKRGIGIATSLHIDSLACDIALRVNGKYTTDPKDHEPLGLVWEHMGRLTGEPLTWGGRFNDAVHFSYSHDGRK